MLKIIFIVALAMLLEFLGLKTAEISGLKIFKNYGISFGLFGNVKYAALILSFIALVLILACLIAIALRRFKFLNFLKLSYAMAVSAGGAAANFAERVIYGYVMDYIKLDLGFMNLYLNIADFEIIIGCTFAGFLFLFYVYNYNILKYWGNKNW